MISARKMRVFVFGSVVFALIGIYGVWRVLTSGVFFPSSQAPPKDSLVLIYVANSGALIGSGDTKVLVDALFDKPNPEYRAPSEEMLDKIMKGTAPFDGVDLVLVTHNHPDHFDAGVAARYLEARPEPFLLAPTDAVEALRQATEDWAKIGPRVIALDLKVGEKAKKDVKRIPVTAFRTLHSGEKESPMNLMYLAELNGWSIFHEGDSTGQLEAYQGFALGSAPVDLALVHFWFPLEPNSARFLQEVLKPNHIALTHLPIRLEGDAPGKISQVQRFYKDIFLLLPGMRAKILQKEDAAKTGAILKAVRAASTRPLRRRKAPQIWAAERRGSRVIFENGTYGPKL